MKGFMRRALATLCVVGAVGLTGCTGERYRNLVDPCYPVRYASQARQAVAESFAPQVQNGHILDQTIWNYHFEPGTAKLTPGGLAKLDEIVRRRPEPDTRLFLATARDVTFNPEDAEKYSNTRRDLDGARVATIQQYLNIQTVGRPLPFEVLVHDPSDPAIHSASAVRAALAQRANYSGGLGGGGGGGGGTASTAITAGGVTVTQPALPPGQPSGTGQQAGSGYGAPPR